MAAWTVPPPSSYPATGWGGDAQGGAPYVEAAALYNAPIAIPRRERGSPGEPMHQANAVDAGGPTGKAAGVYGPH
jgi:hypothetical protein